MTQFARLIAVLGEIRVPTLVRARRGDPIGPPAVARYIDLVRDRDAVATDVANGGGVRRRTRDLLRERLDVCAGLEVAVAGTLTFYFGDDPTCSPTRVHAGQTVIEEGGTRSPAHYAVNEGSEDVRLFVTLFAPKGVFPRIDVPESEAPADCPSP